MHLLTISLEVVAPRLAMIVAKKHTLPKHTQPQTVNGADPRSSIALLNRHKAQCLDGCQKVRGTSLGMWLVVYNLRSYVTLLEREPPWKVTVIKPPRPVLHVANKEQAEDRKPSFLRDWSLYFPWRWNFAVTCSALISSVRIGRQNQSTN